MLGERAAGWLQQRFDDFDADLWRDNMRDKAQEVLMLLYNPLAVQPDGSTGSTAVHRRSGIPLYEPEHAPFWEMGAFGYMFAAGYRVLEEYD
jgi:hypothetical protein